MSKSHIDENRVKPLGMLRYAIEFYAAGMAADKAIGEELGHEASAPAPVNFSICRAMELGLKAFLLQSGHTPQDIIQLGHDLERAFAVAETAGLLYCVETDDEQRHLLKVMNDLYRPKEFEYILTGPKTFPVFGVMQPFVQDCLLSVAREIPGSEVLLERCAGQILRYGGP